MNVATGGLTDLSTGEAIPAQNFATVKMGWVVPSGLSSTARVYAMIDPDNVITEIHDNNNIGFVPLRVQDPTSIEKGSKHLLPDGYVLHQNYPNPFNPSTKINYQLPTRGHIMLKLFDVLGREVGTLVDDIQGPGFNLVRFNATGLTSGVYFYRLQAGTFSATKKFLLLK